MNDLVEKVARALYSRDREGWVDKHPDDFFLDWHDCALEAFKDQWRDEARLAIAAHEAAIEAAGYVIVPRVPNHDMTAAVVEPGEDRTWAVKAYTAMIEASQKG